MGKIKKVTTPKHDATISPALSDFAAKCTIIPLADLPKHLASFPKRWNFPRGDLYHWIATLNRFDVFLERFNEVYGLVKGPQVKEFGNTVLLEDGGPHAESNLRDADLGNDGDKKLVQAILEFSRRLLERCGNRSLYNSGDRLNALLNSTDLELVQDTLQLALCLAQRCHARHRPQHPGSLKSHYGLELERIQLLATQFPTPKTMPKTSAPGSPVKTSKSKDKQTQSEQRNPNPSQLMWMTADVPDEANGGPAKTAWAQAVKVQIAFKPESEESMTNGSALPKRIETTTTAGTDSSATGSSIRDQTADQNSNVQTSTSSSTADMPSTAAPNASKPSEHIFEPSLQTLLTTPIHQVLELGLSTVPSSHHSELLHKLRVAYAVLGDARARRHLATIRLLAVSNLAYVSSDSSFQQHFLTKDREEAKREQLTYQLADLIQWGSRKPGQVPLAIQTCANRTLIALTKQKSAIPDVLTALNTSASHGILVFVLQKLTEDVGKDDTEEKVSGDEWRDSFLSLVYAILATNSTPARAEALASTQIIDSYLSILKLQTDKAQRCYVEIMHFFETFPRLVKDGLTQLANLRVFEAVVQLLKQQTGHGLDLVEEKKGFSAGYRTPSIDYHVPYIIQQVIRSILPFLNAVTTPQSPQADRILRSLIDSQDLLFTFRLIVEKGAQFGSYIWSEVVKVMTTFLNNEPTSYTVLAEAGLTRAFIESIVLKSLAQPSTQASTQPGTANGEGSADAGPEMTQTANADEEPAPVSASSNKEAVEELDCVPKGNESGILPSLDAISAVAQAFNAICITTAGMAFFQTSGALEKFFEIFESPAHVKVMKDSSFMQVLGTSFDELVRHHPDLKDGVLSTVLVMVSRIRFICRGMAWETGAGAKLWLWGPNKNLKVAGGYEALVQDVLAEAHDVVRHENIDLPNKKHLLASTKVDRQVPEKISPGGLDSDGLGVSDYLAPVTPFLVGLFETSGWCSAFVDAGGARMVLDLATLSSLPDDFCSPTPQSTIPTELAQSLHMMAEVKPYLVLPDLLDRILTIQQNLDAFTTFQPGFSQCYTDPFITAPDQTMDPAAEPRQEIGTVLVKNLLALQSLTNILSEVFSTAMYPTRSRDQAHPFSQVNLTDLYVQVCKGLGNIAAACNREAKSLERKISKPMIRGTRPAGMPRDFEGLTHHAVPPRYPEPDAPNGNSGVAARNDSSFLEMDIVGGDESPKNDNDTAVYKNLNILRQFFHELPTSITDCLRHVGHGLIGRKRLDTYQKQNVMLVGAAIAEALICQIEPAFLNCTDEHSVWLSYPDYRFAYLVDAIKKCCRVLFDAVSDPSSSQCLTAVVIPFKQQGGIQALQRVGELFYDELKSRPVSEERMDIITHAHVGLNGIMALFERLTAAKGIAESTQSLALKSTDRSRAHPFNPAQFLLEMRLEVLPFVRTLWDSSWINDASQSLLERLVVVLRSVLTGDHENDANKKNDRPVRASNAAPRKFTVHNEKLQDLIGKGYDEDLARESLFRCNNHLNAADEYCRLHREYHWWRRHPIPDSEQESPGEVTPTVSTPATTAPPAIVVAAPPAPVTPAAAVGWGPFGEEGDATPDSDDDVPISDDESAGHGSQMEGVEHTSEQAPAADAGPVLPAAPITPTAPTATIANSSTVPPAEAATASEAPNENQTEEKPALTVETLNLERFEIRSDLAERCLNVINTHYDLSWELAELMKSATKRLGKQDASEFRDQSYSVLVMSLASYQSDIESNEVTEEIRKKLAACAHFIALLIQDNDIYDECVVYLQEHFDTLLGFIQIPEQVGDSAFSVPFVGEVLLIIEKMLCKDSEPATITWNPPSSINAPDPEPLVRLHPQNVSPKDRKTLFEGLMQLLPRVGKDASLGLSVARVLVSLTRDRQLAIQLGEKRNLQRVFLMMKQLGHLASAKIYSSIMLILRHVIEDADVLRQIMKSEIFAHLDNRSSRQIDSTTYARNLSHLVLRSPDIFVEVTKEMVKLQQYDSNQRPQVLILKPEVKEEKLALEAKADAQDKAEGSKEKGSDTEAGKEAVAPTTESVEAPVDSSSDAKGKSTEMKPPTVEHPDGVIHFLLSQLLSYKDVEDKEPAPPTPPAPAADAMDSLNDLSEDEVFDDSTVPVATPIATPAGAATPTIKAADKFKPIFKAEDHPIYLYRCFLLQCLTELLHSYSRTKVEFINFSRKSDPLAMTPSKPRSGVLNYLLNGLIPLDVIEPDETVSFKKRSSTSEWATKVIIALCSKTGEEGLIANRDRYLTHPRVDDQDREPDLKFVRRFVLEHALRAFKEAGSPGETGTSKDATQARYARMLGLSNLFHHMLSKPNSGEGVAGSNNSSYKIVAKMMFEKDFISALTTSLADIDLSFPGAKRVIKYILKPLNELTETAVYLSLNSSTPVSSALGQSEDDVISSATSVSDLDEGREETPDLFRNSALGMLEPNRDQSDTSSESEMENDDAEMYEEDAYADDMEFEEEGPLGTGNDGEVVSDEDEQGPGAMEGLPADVNMNLELVMDHTDLDMESADEDSEDEEEDEDEEDEDEDGEEEDEDEDEIEQHQAGTLSEQQFVEVFEEYEDVSDEDEEGEDLEDDESMNDPDEDRWGNPQGEIEEVDSQDDLPDLLENATNPGMPLPQINHGPNGDTVTLPLDTLLNILGDAAGGPGGDLQLGGMLPAVNQPRPEGEEDEDEGDNDEDMDEMDENDDEADLEYHTFNEMLNDLDSPFAWDDDQTPMLHHRPHHGAGHHRHHHHNAPHVIPGFMTRHMAGHIMAAPGVHRTHRAPPAARQIDDGTNPLLRAPGAVATTTARPLPSNPLEFLQGLSQGLVNGRALDAMMEAVTRTDAHMEILDAMDTRYHGWDLRMPEGMGRPIFTAPPPNPFRPESTRSGTFTPFTTQSRWQEEVKVLFGLGSIEMTQRVVPELLSVLIPPAIDEERARAKREQEETRRALAEAEVERKKQEVEEKERKAKREQEEKEAAEKARIEQEAADAAAAQAAAENAALARENGNETSEPMEGVQQSDPPTEAGPSTATPATGTDNADTPAEGAAGPSDAAPPVARVFTTIRGQQVDITSMSIDAEYLEALPEEMREEVIMQQYAEQRNAAAVQGDVPADISRDFLDALPEDLRDELLQQEANDRRRRERDAARRQAAEAGGGPAGPEEMDADNFMATLEPALRRQILAEQSDEVLNALAPEFAAEARAMMSRRLQHLGGRVPLGRDGRGDRVRRDAVSAQKEQRKQVVQMVDRAGVATLMRLMFMQQQGSARNNLHVVLGNVCQHRQTRAEVISLLLSILQEGSADVSAVEKSLAHLSLRAKNVPLTKPNFKRTMSSQASQTSLPPELEVTPLVVAQQCLWALSSLTLSDQHVATVFLREIESSVGYKSKSSRKGKAKESRASKFAINALIGLLDRKLITDNSTSMESLSSLLSTISQPLTWLLKKEKDKDSEEKGDDVVDAAASTDANTGASQAQPTTETSQTAPSSDAVVEGAITQLSPDQATGSDTAMVDPPATSAPETAEAEGSGDKNKPDTSAEETKPKKVFEPPVIPEENLRLIVGVLSARECNGKTFRDTLSTITNLSMIPGAKATIGEELAHLSQALSQTISVDLDEFVAKISTAKSATDIQGIATAKFSPASADQAKLLRVLTGLDYLFDPKKSDSGDETSAETKNILKALYESSVLVPLWAKLSECLSAVNKKEGVNFSVATILLPLIESLMVVSKNTSVNDVARNARGESVISNGPAGDSAMEEFFFKFTTDHRKILNELVRQNSKLMNANFALLAKNPKVLEFDNKRTYFNRQLHTKSREARQSQPPLQLSIRRNEVFPDSFSKLHFKSADEIKYGKLSIRFQGEEGVDAGGVSREWFQVLARGMFNPDYALFLPVASDRTTFHPNPLSWINEQHLAYFKFVGRIIGKALYEGRVLDCHFSRAVYRRILGKTVSLKDMETLDLDYYKSLVWMLENDVTDIITETFSIETEDFGENRTIDLIENGRNVPVTNDNKQEYIQLVVEHRLTGSVQDQLQNFLDGFHDIIPAELVRIFNEQELELLISGLPDINVDDWKANTEYHTYSASSRQVLWFWRAVRSFDKEEQAKLLQFVTGTSKVPLNGFKELEGMNGFSKFNIHKDYGNRERLPSSHTCFNQLDLPEYETYETLRQRLLTAMLQGSEYFGFA